MLQKLKLCTKFRHPTDEQLGHVDTFFRTSFSNYYNLPSVYFEYIAPYEKVLHPIIYSKGGFVGWIAPSNISFK